MIWRKMLYIDKSYTRRNGTLWLKGTLQKSASVRPPFSFLQIWITRRLRSAECGTNIQKQISVYTWTGTKKVYKYIRVLTKKTRRSLRGPSMWFKKCLRSLSISLTWMNSKVAELRHTQRLQQKHTVKIMENHRNKFLKWTKTFWIHENLEALYS